MGFDNWEILRRTGQFAAEPPTDEEVDASIAWVGLPPRMPGEPLHKWSRRIAAERDLGDKAVAESIEIDNFGESHGEGS